MYTNADQTVLKVISESPTLNSHNSLDFSNKSLKRTRLEKLERHATINDNRNYFHNNWADRLITSNPLQNARCTAYASTQATWQLTPAQKVKNWKSLSHSPWPVDGRWRVKLYVIYTRNSSHVFLSLILNNSSRCSQLLTTHLYTYIA